MKKKGFILGALMLIGVSSIVACESNAVVSGLKPVIEFRDIENEVEEPKDSIVEFQIYGELAPDDYLSESDTISLKYGFKFKRLAGCVVTSELMDSVSLNNAKSVLLMEEKYGSDWKNQMESKTGKRITFNR
jgi:hypothetical protein